MKSSKKKNFKIAFINFVIKEVCLQNPRKSPVEATFQSHLFQLTEKNQASNSPNNAQKKSLHQNKTK
jgi:hypothetical protein